MTNLNDKFKKILDDLEENIKNKEDLEYIKTQIFNLYHMFFEEISRIEETSNTKISTLAETQSLMDGKIKQIEKTLSGLEKELYVEDYSDFSVVCPYCNYEFTIDYEELKDEIVCPECNNPIELDWGDEGESGEGHHCSGNCHDCHHDEDDDM